MHQSTKRQAVHTTCLPAGSARASSCLSTRRATPTAEGNRLGATMKVGKTDIILRLQLDAVSTVAFDTETYTSADDIPVRAIVERRHLCRSSGPWRRDIHLFHRGYSRQLCRRPRLNKHFKRRFCGPGQLVSDGPRICHARAASYEPRVSASQSPKAETVIPAWISSGSLARCG